VWFWIRSFFIGTNNHKHDIDDRSVVRNSHCEEFWYILLTCCNSNYAVEYSCCLVCAKNCTELYVHTLGKHLVLHQETGQSYVSQPWLQYWGTESSLPPPQTQFMEQLVHCMFQEAGKPCSVMLLTILTPTETNSLEMLASEKFL
jgi:hypothetical protein